MLNIKYQIDFRQAAALLFRTLGINLFIIFKIIFKLKYLDDEYIAKKVSLGSNELSLRAWAPLLLDQSDLDGNFLFRIR